MSLDMPQYSAVALIKQMLLRATFPIRCLKKLALTLFVPKKFNL